MSSSSTPPQHPRPSKRRRLGNFVFLSLFYVLLIASLATFFAKTHWIPEIACHLRVQIFLGLALCCLITIVKKNKLRFLAAFIFLLVHAAWIAPYFFPATTPVNPTQQNATFKIMSANLWKDNDQHDAFSDLVRQHAPDIIVVLEVTAKWEQAITDALADDYRYRKIVAKEHAFGIGILSKFPLKSVTPIIATDTELVTLDTRLTGPTGRPLRLIATHPFPPLSQHCFTTRSQQLIGLAEQIDAAQDTILAGDFNLTPWSPVFTEMLRAGHLNDSRIGFGLANTWYEFPTFLTGIQIDHVLTSASLTTVNHQVSGHYGSDHRAVIVEINQQEDSVKRPLNQTSDRTSPAQNRPQNTTDAPLTSSTSANPRATDASTDSPTDSPEARLSIVYSPDYLIDLGGMEKLHPFDIRKYEKIYAALLSDNLITKKQTIIPNELTTEDLRLIHTDDYLRRLKIRSNIAKYLETDLLRLYPGSLDTAVLRPFRIASGGTLTAAREALNCGIGVNIGGGYHHAKPNIGEGFCIYADVPIAIRRLQKEGRIKNALVIDVDVHQGNGTAECLAGDDSTFTFSMHQADIYPVPKSTSDRDVELQSGDGDERFMEVLEMHLDDVIQRSGADICFIVGGCDTLAGDPLAALTMTQQGICRRDAAIIDRCVSGGIPVVLTLAGGYSQNAWRSQYLSIKTLIQKYGISTGN